MTSRTPHGRSSYWHLLGIAAAALSGCGAAWVALRVTSVQWPGAGLSVFAFCFAAALLRRSSLPTFVRAIEEPSGRLRRCIAVGIGVTMPLVLLGLHVLNGTVLEPRFHDEHSYLIQARMLAEGRLWLPSHAIPDAFESMHLLVRPVYSSIYFPGTALSHVPAIWLGLPYWVTPLAIAGVSASLLYLVVLRLVDGLAAIVAVILLLGLPTYRETSSMVISQPLMLLLGLLMMYCWLRWRNGPCHLGTCVALATVSGLALITRPIEAMAIALPIGLSMLHKLRACSWPRIVLHLALLILLPLPFLALQAVHNWGTTGKWTRFASDDFVARNYPAPMIGWTSLDPSFQPGAMTPSITYALIDWVIPNYLQHRGPIAVEWFRNRWPTLAYGISPNGIMLVPAAIGLLALARRERWVTFVPIPLTLAFYAFYVFYIVHYPLVVFAGFAVSVTAMPQAIAPRSASTRRQLALSLGLAASVALLMSMRQFGGAPLLFEFGDLNVANRRIAAVSTSPSIVLVTFRPGANTHQEPVYNIGHAAIDDNDVIRAHDLGPAMNLQLLGYYQRTQPYRRVYVYDRGTRQMSSLGTVSDAMSHFRRQLDAPDVAPQ
jgi:hypothetical protein